VRPHVHVSAWSCRRWNMNNRTQTADEAGSPAAAPTCT
jgi:hypothetical protein